MQKRYLPISLCVIVTLIIAIAGYFIPTADPSTPERILLDNPAGKVVFDHKTHFEKYGIPCQKCHHESPEKRANVQACGSCHGVTFDAAFKSTHMKTMQDKDACATCHHMQLSRKDWGHKKHSEEYDVACRDCHHKSTDIEPEPQNCADCHQTKGDKDMPSLRKAVHTKCKGCHEEVFAKKVNGCVVCHTKVPTRPLVSQGKFSVPPQFANCAACHVGQKTQDLVPGRMAAFHGQCIKCHEGVGKGPYTKQQCSQCHTK